MHSGQHLVGGGVVEYLCVASFGWVIVCSFAGGESLSLRARASLWFYWQRRQSSRQAKPGEAGICAAHGAGRNTCNCHDDMARWQMGDGRHPGEHDMSSNNTRQGESRRRKECNRQPRRGTGVDVIVKKAPWAGVKKFRRFSVALIPHPALALPPETHYGSVRQAVVPSSHLYKYLGRRCQLLSRFLAPTFPTFARRLPSHRVASDLCARLSPVLSL